MEDDSCVDKKQISQAAGAILQVAMKSCKSDLMNPLEQQAINLQLSFKKVPNVRNNAIIKIPLPTSITQSVTDVCLFVKDLDKSSRDCEATVRHYKELLESKGIKHPIEVIPLKLLKLEYQPYEAKRNLSNMYDVFLADDRIVRLLPRHLGKHFLSRKKFPMQVNLQAKDLQKEIGKVLSMTQCVMTGRGSNCQVTVARTGMSADQIAKNIEAAILKLTNHIPGGTANVRNLHIKTINSPSLPIFLSLGKRDDVILPKKERKYDIVEPEEVTTVRGALVKITRFGRIELVKTPEVAEEAGLDEDDEGPLIEGSDDEEDKSDEETATKVKQRRKGKDTMKASNKRARSPDSDEEDDQEEGSSEQEEGSSNEESDGEDAIQTITVNKTSMLKKREMAKSKSVEDTSNNGVPKGKKRKSVAGKKSTSKKAKIQVTDPVHSNKKRKTGHSEAVEHLKPKKRTGNTSPKAQRNPKKITDTSKISPNAVTPEKSSHNKSLKSPSSNLKSGKSTPKKAQHKSPKSVSTDSKVVKSGRNTPKHKK